MFNIIIQYHYDTPKAIRGVYQFDPSWQRAANMLWGQVSTGTSFIFRIGDIVRHMLFLETYVLCHSDETEQEQIRELCAL